jgi:hypothetical protein
MILTAKIKRSDIEYPIWAERGALNRLREFLPAHGRALILTGSGVPSNTRSAHAGNSPALKKSLSRTARAQKA